MNRIDRDIYVLEDSLEWPIAIVQGTNGLPIVFHFRDYDVPNGTVAKIYVEKPSGKEIWETGTVSGNDVTVNVIKQMVAEPGAAKMQIALDNDENIIYSFIQEIDVKKCLIAVDSENGSPLLDEYIQRINEIVSVALNDTQEKADYAEDQGDYAKEQGDYAKSQGNYAKDETLRISNAFASWVETLTGTQNGALLLEIQSLLDDMYRMATDADIDKIIAGTYVDEDDEGSIFEPGTKEDIDNIIGGTYVDAPDTPNEGAEDSAIQSIIDALWK